MLVLARPRQSGKTTDLIKSFLGDPNGIFVSHTAQRAAQVAREFDVPEDAQERMLSIFTLKEGAGSGTWMTWLKGKRLYIDDVDLILLQLIGLTAPIVKCTITSEEYGDEHHAIRKETGTEEGVGGDAEQGRIVPPLWDSRE